MPRIPRNFYTNSLFHVITQGIHKEFIFQSNYHKAKYLQILLKKLSNFSDVQLLAYCIMGNHAHHLIYSSNTASISALMKSVNISYARWYNIQTNRVGYVFRDRFLSEPILNAQHLFACLSYIHNNPVKAGIVTHPQNYAFSSYQQYLYKTGIVN